MLRNGLSIFKSYTMKKLLLIIILFIGFSSYSQTDIKEVSSVDVYTSKDANIILSKLTIDTVNKYCLLFRDEQYEYIDDFKYIMFTDTTQVIKFIELAISSIRTLKEYQFMLDDQYIYFGEHLDQGLIIYAKKGWFSLRFKQANELLIKLREHEKNQIIQH